MKKNQDKPKFKKLYRLFVNVMDKSRMPIEENGKLLYPTIWLEVTEVNLGSLKNPDPEILGIRFEPLQKERLR